MPTWKMFNESAFFILLGVAWIGHAYLWTGLLNHLYGRPIPKPLLKVWRLFTGVAILALPFLPWGIGSYEFPQFAFFRNEIVGRFFENYIWFCVFVGGMFFPAVTLYRILRRVPRAVVSERSDTVDYKKELGRVVVGDGKLRRLSTLPFNDVFKVDFTELSLALEKLPAAWEGLRIDVLSDLHFCGTPSKAFFDRVIDRLTEGPKPDLVVLAGDYVDTDRHREWIVPILGRLSGIEGQFAILGNHDAYHDPEAVRAELRAAGYTVLGNSWTEVDIRGTRCVIIGHEGPWFRPVPNLSHVPSGSFRLCISHSPDSFAWAVANRIGLMLCGHVHGGQIRVPVIGSIFVPSIYGRRFDMGVFQSRSTVMAVGRGLSGKEPLRFRCRPQVLRLQLTTR